LILSRVQLIRKLLEWSRINAVHFIKHKPCRTAVDLIRPSTSFFGRTDVDARNKRGHDGAELVQPHRKMLWSNITVTQPFSAHPAKAGVGPRRYNWAPEHGSLHR